MSDQPQCQYEIDVPDSSDKIHIVDYWMNLTDSERFCAEKYNGILYPIKTRHQLNQVLPYLQTCTNEDGHKVYGDYYRIGLTTYGRVGNFSDHTSYDADDVNYKQLYLSRNNGKWLPGNPNGKADEDGCQTAHIAVEGKSLFSYRCTAKDKFICLGSAPVTTVTPDDSLVNQTDYTPIQYPLSSSSNC